MTSESSCVQKHVDCDVKGLSTWDPCYGGDSICGEMTLFSKNVSIAKLEEHGRYLVSPFLINK